MRLINADVLFQEFVERIKRCEQGIEGCDAFFNSANVPSTELHCVLSTIHEAPTGLFGLETKLHEAAENAENSEVRKGILQAIDIIKGADE